jgi:hypothetical protein
MPKLGVYSGGLLYWGQPALTNSALLQAQKDGRQKELKLQKDSPPPREANKPVFNRNASYWGFCCTLSLSRTLKPPSKHAEQKDRIDSRASLAFIAAQIRCAGIRLTRPKARCSRASSPSGQRAGQTGQRVQPSKIRIRMQRRGQSSDDVGIKSCGVAAIEM